MKISLKYNKLNGFLGVGIRFAINSGEPFFGFGFISINW